MSTTTAAERAEWRALCENDRATYDWPHNLRDILRRLLADFDVLPVMVLAVRAQALKEVVVFLGLHAETTRDEHVATAHAAMLYKYHQVLDEVTEKAAPFVSEDGRLK